MNSIRAAFYARVSSEQQATAHTIESQLAALSERAQADGSPVPLERQFVDDGYSGATFVRPAMDRLRDLAAVGGVDRIYVHSPDRLARNYAYQVLLIDEWRRVGVEIVFLNRSLGQSPEDDLLLQVQGIVSEYERAKIMERSRRGKKHAAQRGSLNVMSHAPYGYRYITVHDGQGQARFEPIPEQADVIRDIFTWVGRERCSLGEVCRRLQGAGELMATGKRIWSRQTVWHILQNPVYQGTAAYGKTHMMPRTRKSRPRPSRGRPAEPRRSHSAIAVDQQEWVFVPAPAVVDRALFDAAQGQLRENRTRARLGPRRPGHLLQGLTCCALCGYAFYGKTTRQRGRGHRMRDFRCYRCSGTDAYRFGGERICSNTQIRAESLEAEIWENVCKIVRNPGSLQQEDQDSIQRKELPENVDALRAQRQKLRRGLERLIDSLAEGVIDKDQFTSRMNRTKARMADIDKKIGTQAADEELRTHVRSVMNRLAELSTHLQSQLNDADWATKREIVRALVQRIEIGPTKVAVVLRLPMGTSARALEPIIVTLSRV
ncbi:MAG TPA: recombinase family protein [Bryobacteraceae bacterium]|nr:recombinase family protein [Bryobacteraceae bacterium]